MSIWGVQSRKTYEALSSGYKINRAADDAAGLAISEKMNSQSTGLSVGSDNAADGKSLINVAEGALAGIQESLQRIHELGLRASNGLYSASDKAAYQLEIDGLKDHIQYIAKNTSFNTLKLLEGSMADIQLATNPQGGGLKIQLANSTLESLGIADFDVTKDFDLSTIDVTKDFDLSTIDLAMEKVSSARSQLGAQSNRLDHTIAYNDYANYNTVAANSRIRDTDYGEEIIKKNRDEVLQKYRLFAMKAKMQSDAGFLRLF